MADILFEFVRQGAYVKVTAWEAETKTEAVVVVPASLNEEQMKAKAMQKLLYLLQKMAKD